MEDTLKDQTSVSGSKGGKSAKLLRYPLRSASKSKDDKLPASSPSIASASKRVKSTSVVSQSVGVLDISGKEKSAKPPRRLSIPSKPTSSPAPKAADYITPTSDARANRASIMKGKSDNTPGSDVSRSSNRKRFTVLSSASYWLSHIKLSEAAGKHQLSLGFFKLALEAGCENVQLLRDELKLYACRHNLLDLGESAKEVFRSYEIHENIDQIQVSETFSHMPEEGTYSLDDDAHSLSSGVSKLKSRSLNNSASSRIKASVNKKTVNQSPVFENGNDKIQKNYKNPNKQKVKTEGMKLADEKGQLDTSPKEAVVEENKENMDASPVEEMCLEG